jgi:hypothetical protein
MREVAGEGGYHAGTNHRRREPTSHPTRLAGAHLDTSSAQHELLIRLEVTATGFFSREPITVASLTHEPKHQRCLAFDNALTNATIGYPKRLRGATFCGQRAALTNAGSISCFGRLGSGSAAPLPVAFLSDDRKLNLAHGATLRRSNRRYLPFRRDATVQQFWLSQRPAPLRTSGAPVHEDRRRRRV